MTNAQDTVYTIYLLHFDRLQGRVQHYVGITRSDRLDKRMLEHCGAFGSSVTAAAARDSNPFTLVKTYPAVGHDEERRIKRGGHFAKRCPICLGRLDLDGAWKRYVQRPTAPPSGGWSGVGWKEPPQLEPEPPKRRAGS